MRAQELIAAMAEQGLWSSPAGKTPAATLYAAMIRDARDKGEAARFRKVGPGQFESTGKEATMPATTPRIESFAVEGGRLVRKVVPRRGQAYEHRCPLDAYQELAWAAIDLAADGFTVETLADQVHNRPQEGHGDREPWASYTNAAVAIAFWKERGLLDVRRRRNHVDGECFIEDAMVEFHALAENA